MYLLILAADISSKLEWTRARVVSAHDFEGGKGSCLDFPFSHLLHKPVGGDATPVAGPPITCAGNAFMTCELAWPRR